MTYQGLWSHSKMPFSQDSPFVSKKDLSRSFFIANFYTPNVVLFSVTFNTLLLVWGRKKRHDYSNIRGCGVSSSGIHN